jgi:hypothetical protein
MKEYERDYRPINSPIIFTTRLAEKELLKSKIVYSAELVGVVCSFLFIAFVLGPRSENFINWVQAVL